MSESLRADAGTLQRLAASDRAMWRRLVAQASSSEACPPDLTRALLAIDDFDGWLRRLASAYSGLHPDDGIGADIEIRRWLAAGIARTLPATDIRALDMRHREALCDRSADAAAHTRELVVAIERAHPGADLLGRTYLVLARQLSEDLDQEAAIAAARSAEAVFEQLGNEAWRAQAVRMRGAGLLRAGRIDEALEVLDSVADARSTSFSSMGARRHEGVVLGEDGRYHPERELGPVDAVLYRAGATAIWASRTDPEWRTALGEVARATRHLGCARRAENDSTLTEEDAWLHRGMR